MYTLDDISIAHKRVLVRADLNVPIHNGIIQDDTRIRALLPTLKTLMAQECSICLLAHLGRPKNKWTHDVSLKPIALKLSEMLREEVIFLENLEHALNAMQKSPHRSARLYLLENIRFYPEEEQNDPAFGQQLAQLADAYINDAFSVSHRAHASVEAVTHYLPSIAGPQLVNEVRILKQVLESSRRPTLAIIGGAKVSTKLGVLKTLVHKVDFLALGGGMANTFLKAQGFPMGASLVEDTMIQEASDILINAASTGCSLLLPQDGAVTYEEDLLTVRQEKCVGDLNDHDRLVDIGQQSLASIKQAIDRSQIVLWNGPVGLFEKAPFDQATRELALYLAQKTHEGTITSIAGGGDTIAALNKAGVFQKLSYVSMAGGAFLEWFEGKELPGLKALERAVQKK